MIEVIFALDYEIYGNKKGSLRKSVFEPAERLRPNFSKMERATCFLQNLPFRIMLPHKLEYNKQYDKS